MKCHLCDNCSGILLRINSKGEKGVFACEGCLRLLTNQPFDKITLEIAKALDSIINEE